MGEKPSLLCTSKPDALCLRGFSGAGDCLLLLAGISSNVFTHKLCLRTEFTQVPNNILAMSHLLRLTKDNETADHIPSYYASVKTKHFFHINYHNFRQTGLHKQCRLKSDMADCGIFY